MSHFPCECWYVSSEGLKEKCAKGINNQSEVAEITLLIEIALHLLLL